MKILLLRGGLGNQLFIYGAYKYLSSNNKCVFIDDINGFSNDYRFKRINLLSEMKLDYKKFILKPNLIWKLLNKISDNKNFLFFSNKYFK